MKKMIGFNKGVNFGGWLSQCNYEKEHLDSFITENDFKIAASWGIDHIRVPFDYNIIENNDGSFNDEGFAYLTMAVNACKANGLNIILDLHKTAGFSFDYYGEDEHGFFDSEEYQERFYRLWEEVARRYGSLTPNVAFELLNEVTDASFIDAWNRIAKECIRRIRAIAPDVIILVGSYYNNSASTVQYLDEPYDDNVFYNMHCYEPLKFTHQGAYWTDAIIPEERMAFEDSVTSEEYFEELFSTAIAKAEKHGTGLYCGEYGCIDVVSPEDTLKWYRTINAVFRKHNIGRAAWNYKAMDFGLSDERLSVVHDQLISLL
ncbi:glycoside hydrolase family 5 protein [Ruminococcus sp.]|uniref:glycoside hydrolase family 5 protein n=1 Tax=Ruminococcus sp. TaxID=41978 RepID=UPI0025EB39F8|nr:glycoside hydrolase family 5 protein [Ruminococcus sp.]MCR4638866.1 glycoside hydrolase family 5 protein [Ruminococcus sp.]